MKDLFLVCLALFACNSTVNAQTEEDEVMSKVNLHIEATTLIFINSVFVNIESKFLSSDSEKFHLYGRAGIGHMDIPTLIFCNGQNASGGHLGLTMLTGKGNRHFEVNAGGFLGSFKSKNNDSGVFDSCDDGGFGVYPLIEAGYRFQKPEGGFVFRAKIGTLGVGIGLGHAF